MRRIVFLPRAIEDLAAITEYSRREYGERRGRKYILDIRSACRDLANGHKVGRRSDDPIPGFWKHRIASHFVFYMMFPNRMEIVRVLHGSMIFEDHL